MKNIIAIISGVIVSLILFALVSVLVMKFNVEPYASFGKGNFTKGDLSTLQNKIVILNYYIVLPIVSLIACCIVGYIAKSKEYILGIISIIPVVILFFDKSVTWIFSVIVVVIFSLVGVVLSKKLKNIRAKLNS